MKKILSIIMALAMLAGLLALPSSAKAAKSEVIPTIAVTGYASTNLYLNYGKDNQKQVWPFAVSAAVSQTISDFGNFFPSLFELMKGNPEPAGRAIGNGGRIILEEMLFNEDGSSKYPVETHPNNPATANCAYLLKNDKGNMHEPQLCAELAKEIGYENIYVFYYDYRTSALDCAESLSTYVKAVREYSGSDKVNLFGLSFGGFIVGAYLSLHGTEGFIKNAVMDVPALGGASFAKDFLLGEVDMPFQTLVSFGETALGLETDLARRFGSTDISKFNGIAEAFLKAISAVPQYWGSMWDLLKPEDYNVLKAQLLDPVKSAELIRKSDIVHNDIMQSYREKFTACKQAGVNISIICSTGSDSAFGDEYYADILLDVDKVSGARCAKLGENFADGYEPLCTVCADKTHNHLSPAMCVDASCGYLPENTWFIDGQYHGLYAFEDCSLSLVMKLLMTDDEITVHTFTEYPQFEISSHKNRGIHASFDKSGTGYVTADDTSFNITNISEKYSVKIISVKCSSADISFDLGKTFIKKGATLSVPIKLSSSGTKPKHITVTVEYLKIGKLYTSERTFDVTIK